MRTLLYVVVIVMIQGSMRSVATAEERPGPVNSSPSPICFSSLCLKKGMSQVLVCPMLVHNKYC
jgi:hypothetical protein